MPGDASSAPAADPDPELPDPEGASDFEPHAAERVAMSASAASQVIVRVQLLREVTNVGAEDIGMSVLCGAVGKWPSAGTSLVVRTTAPGAS